MIFLLYKKNREKQIECINKNHVRAQALLNAIKLKSDADFPVIYFFISKNLTTFVRF
jgi:hypothetical protein